MLDSSLRLNVRSAAPDRLVVTLPATAHPGEPVFVRREKDGTPVRGASVNLNSELQEVRRYQITKADGVFRFEGLPNSSAKLAVKGDHYAWRIIQLGSFTNQTLDVRLTRAGYLRGRADRAKLQIQLVPLGRGEPYEFESGHERSIREEVVPGIYRVRFLGRDGPMIEVKEGETTRLELKTR